MPYEHLTATDALSDCAAQIRSAAIADGPSAIWNRMPENLAVRARQIEQMASGSAASLYDLTQTSGCYEPEVPPIVDVATSWGSYVTVHASTPNAIRVALAHRTRALAQLLPIAGASAVLLLQDA